MPTKPEKYIAISNKFKVSFYPIVFSVINAFLLIAFIISRPDDLAGALILLCILLFVLCIALPAYCIVYTKRVLTREKHGFAFTFYNSTLITLSYALTLCTKDETYIYSLLLFGWCELWTLIPWLIFRKQINN